MLDRRSALAALLAASPLALAACGSEAGAPQDAPPAAAVETVQTTPDVTDAPAAPDLDEPEERDAAAMIGDIPAGEYALEDTHAYITFSYSHLGLSRPILRFDEWDAAATLAEDPAASSVTVTIDPASINSGIERFDEHLVGGDMFDVAAHPEITFASTSVDLAKGTLTGDLTMKGITKPVTLDVTLNGAGAHPRSGTPAFGISATGTLDRSDWDLGYAAPAVGTEVDLRIEAEFLRAE